jgi:hypothetical protein
VFDLIQNTDENELCNTINIAMMDTVTCKLISRLISYLLISDK